MAEGHRREEFEALRHTPVLWINDRWATPSAKRSIGAKMVTRKLRWVFNARFHGGRRHSKKGRK